jgi:hypothetical protein
MYSGPQMAIGTFTGACRTKHRDSALGFFVLVLTASLRAGWEEWSLKVMIRTCRSVGVELELERRVRQGPKVRGRRER